MISRDLIQDIYPLTPMQKGMLFHHISNKDNDNYFQQDVLRLHGTLDVALVEKSLQKLIELNDVFRTVFIYENVKEFIQVVLRKATAKVRTADFSRLTKKKREEAFSAFVAADKSLKISLCSEIPVRIAVVTLSENEYALIWSYHHIVMDGWCLGLVISDFFGIYGDIKAGLTALGKYKRPEYGTYLKWLMKKDIPRALVFWDSVLDGYDTDIKLPCLRSDTSPFTESVERFGESTFTPDAKLKQRILDYCRNSDITVSIFFESIWGFILGKYNYASDVVFAKVVSGRPPEIENVGDIIGLFINTIPVRLQWVWEDCFSELVKTQRKASFAATEFDYAPLFEVQSRSKKKNSLINHVFVVENFPVDEGIQNMEGLSSLGLEVEDFSNFEMTNYDLTVVVNSHKLEWIFRYVEARFDRERLELLLKHLETCIRIIVDNPNIRLGDIDILVDSEKSVLLALHDNRLHNFPRNATINSILTDVCIRFPFRVALTFEERTVTYAELQKMIRELSTAITYAGVKRHEIVAIKLERGIEMIVSMLAVLEAGCAYLPINDDLPEERVKFLLDDSKARLLLAEKDDVAKYGNLVQVINPESGLRVPQNAVSKLDDAQYGSSPDDIAYIIYTSGTTGKPKGVMIDHRNVIRLLFNDSFQFDFTEHDVWSFFHSFNFDFSVWEMYGALLYGGRLVIVPKETTKDTNDFLELLETERITILNQTPQAFYNLSDFESLRGDPTLSVRYVIYGGEALAPDKLHTWKSRYPSTKLINMYGITETTVHVTYKEISEKEIASKISNIGAPIPTNSCYVFDPVMKLSPRGVPGELCVGGEGVGRGYLNNPELTGKRFVQNPYRNEETIYRSGDLVVLSDSGEMVYLGRMDHQVKIRGYRIEIGEVEHTLCGISGIRKAVVLPFAKAGSTSLAAFFVASQEIDIDTLRMETGKRLPDYMVPELFCQVPDIPLTVNGKIDRESLLAEIETSRHCERQCDKADTETGKRIEKIWETVLKTANFGLHEDFFMVGGNSILAAQLVFQYNREFSVTLPFQIFFEKPTVAAMETYVTGNFIDKEDIKINEERLLEDSRIDGIVPDPDADSLSTVMSHVLLTGATGFLGAFLLRDLIEMTDATVYCHVRAENDSLGFAKIRGNLEHYEIWKNDYESRIVPVTGDLEKARLGMHDDKYEVLAKTIDTVIHNAAVANFSYSYEKLQAVNSESVREIVRFATVRKLKAIHYVSTNSVFGNVNTRNVKEADIPQPGNVIGDNGYVQTKWVGERIATSARSLGIPVNIYRPGRIGGSNINGACNDSDMLWQFVRLGVKMGSIFDSGMPMDLVPVDYVSRAIVEIALDSKNASAEYHLFNENVVEFDKIVEWTKELFEIHSTPYTQWYLRVANSAGTPFDSMASRLVPLLPSDESSLHSEFVRVFDDSNVMKVISHTTRNMKNTDRDVFLRTLRFMQRKGFFEEKRDV